MPRPRPTPLLITAVAMQLAAVLVYAINACTSTSARHRRGRSAPGPAAPPGDKLEVDKSFVDGIGGPGEEAVIATAMIQITDGLHVPAVAEGVETAEQADTLHRLGYRFAQGYHFSRPLAPEQVAEHLAAVTPATG